MGSNVYRIFAPEELNSCENITVVISVLDASARGEIIKKLQELGLLYKAVEEVLYPELPPIERNRKLVADYHMEQMNDYFEKAEGKSAMNVFWAENSLFRKKFDRLFDKRCRACLWAWTACGNVSGQGGKNNVSGYFGERY